MAARCELVEYRDAVESVGYGREGLIDRQMKEGSGWNEVPNLAWLEYERTIVTKTDQERFAPPLSTSQCMSIGSLPFISFWLMTATRSPCSNGEHKISWVFDLTNSLLSDHVSRSQRSRSMVTRLLIRLTLRTVISGVRWLVGCV
jgi:hypothetical protein